MLDRESGPLGLLTHNRTTTMGLDRIPTDLDDQREPTPNIPEGQTHRLDEPCPFDDDHLPERLRATCCTIRARLVAIELMALGEERLGRRMLESMSGQEALAFAKELQRAADGLEGKYRGKRRKPTGASVVELDESKKAWVLSRPSSFTEAIAVIRGAARWYERIVANGGSVSVEE